MRGNIASESIPITDETPGARIVVICCSKAGHDLAPVQFEQIQGFMLFSFCIAVERFPPGVDRLRVFYDRATEAIVRRFKRLTRGKRCSPLSMH